MNWATVIFVTVMSGLIYGIFRLGKKSGKSQAENANHESYKKDVDEYIKKSAVVDSIVSNRNNYDDSDIMSGNLSDRKVPTTADARIKSCLSRKSKRVKIN